MVSIKIPRYDPWSEFICTECRNGKHPKEHHVTYYDKTGMISCPCKTCFES